jgi:exopolysaccharide biosynthesis polyprenyl glycosylphosphotransferase
MFKPVRATSYLTTLFILDILWVQASLQLAMQLRYTLPFGNVVLPGWAPILFYAPTLWLHAIVLIIWTLSLSFGSLYVARRVAYWGEEFQRLILAHSVASLVLAGLLYLAKAELPRLTFVYFYILGLVLMLASRALLRFWRHLHRQEAVNRTRIVIAGDGPAAQTLIDQVRKLRWPGLQLVGVLRSEEMSTETLQSNVQGLPVLGDLEDAEMVARASQVDVVVVALPRTAHQELAGLVMRLNRLPVRLYIAPDYFDLAFHDATIERLGPVPLIGLRDPAIDGMQRIMKRLMDITLSAIGLMILAPVFAAIALAVKLEDKGPVIYHTLRVGENGRVFGMLKFRSMSIDAERIQAQVNRQDESGVLIHKRPDDPRVTRVGRILRRTSLDELPQLVNVLAGDMSLVGPRPELPWLVDRYSPWQHKRFAVPQGMTGWWQINGRSDNPMHMHTDQDLYYIQHYSLWLDIQILWRTIAVVLRGRGAY